MPKHWLYQKIFGFAMRWEEGERDGEEINFSYIYCTLGKAINHNVTLNRAKILFITMFSLFLFWERTVSRILMFAVVFGAEICYRKFNFVE